MALMLRKSVLPKNISLLKCMKGRPIASASFKKNPAVLSNNAWKKVIRGYSRKQFERPEPSVRNMKLNPNTTRPSFVPRRSISSPCISTRIPERFSTLRNSRSMTIHARPLFQYRCYSRFCGVQALNAAGTCSCLPPPCDCPPKCIQYMTGYYYYPYGTWFCGPYHVTGTCAPCGGPVTPGGPCGPGGPCPGTPCGLPGITPCKCGPCLPCCGCVLESGTSNYTMSHPHCVPFASGVPGPFQGTVDMYGQFGSGLSSGGSSGYNASGFHDPMNVFASHGVPGGFHNGPMDFSGQYNPYSPYQGSYPQQTFDPNMPFYPSQHNANQSCGPCYNVPIQPVEVEPFMMPENIPKPEFYTQQQPQPAPAEVKQKTKCNAFPLYPKPEERKDLKGTSPAAECLTSAAYSSRTNPFPKSPKFQIPTPYRTRFEKPRP